MNYKFILFLLFPVIFFSCKKDNVNPIPQSQMQQPTTSQAFTSLYDGHYSNTIDSLFYVSNGQFKCTGPNPFSFSSGNGIGTFIDLSTDSIITFYSSSGLQMESIAFKTIGSISANHMPFTQVYTYPMFGNPNATNDYGINITNGSATFESDSTIFITYQNSHYLIKLYSGLKD